MSAGLFAIAVDSAYSLTVPFTEDFHGGASGWRDSGGTHVTGHSGSGGVGGGGYVQADFSFAHASAEDSAVIFRAQDEFGSSGGAFQGDWSGGGVTSFSAFVRHDAPEALTFFVRFAGAHNWPGAVAVNFMPVAPGEWTQLSVDIEASNPQFVGFEGSDFGTVFGNVGHVQIGVSVPSGLAGSETNYSFGLDEVSVVPEPASLVLLAGGAVVLSNRGRRSSKREAL